MNTQEQVAESVIASARAAEEAHRERIHTEIADDLDAIDKTGPLDLFSIVGAIAAGRIRHLAITY
jgi:hypothetical protein